MAFFYLVLANHLWFFQQFGRLGHWKTSPWFWTHVLLVAIGSWGRVFPNALKMHWQIISSTQSLQLFTAKKMWNKLEAQCKVCQAFSEQSAIIIPYLECVPFNDSKMRDQNYQIISSQLTWISVQECNTENSLEVCLNWWFLLDDDKPI